MTIPLVFRTLESENYHTICITYLPAMRTVVLLLLTSMSFSVYSQQTETPGFLTEIGRSTDGLIKACLQVDENGYEKELLIYKNGKNWDTLSIARERESDMGDTCFIQTTQIDQKGLKEVVLSWSGQLSHSYGGPLGGGFDHKCTKHEIWNLNTGKKLFAAQSAYYHEESTGYYSKTDSSVLGTRTATCSYQYAFSVTKEGKIVISDLKEKNSVRYEDETIDGIKEEKNDCSSSRPDHRPGVYLFRSGKFVRAGK